MPEVGFDDFQMRSGGVEPLGEIEFVDFPVLAENPAAGIDEDGRIEDNASGLFGEAGADGDIMVLGRTDKG